MLIITLLYGGKTSVSLAVMLFSFIGLDEFFRMFLSQEKSERFTAAAVGALIPASSFCTGVGITPLFLAAAALLLSSYLLFTFKEISSAGKKICAVLAGFIYIPFLLGFIAEIRGLESGIGWILIMLASVMCGDSAAYYFGSAFGRHKLYPSVSPNKSIEGSIAGLFGSVAGAILLSKFIFHDISILHAAIAALICGITGQTGDLFESMLKRSAGVKDSGSIFPGHGGALDRLDSILFASPALYIYLKLVVI